MPRTNWERYILVVEDDRALRELYRSGLRAEGYAVVAVQDGLDALRLIESAKPRAVVLDLALPRLDGREVLYELRANPATQRIPVIVVTGTDASDLAPTYSCLLKKPVSATELADAVLKHIHPSLT